jgi:hypothetical protein
LGLVKYITNATGDIVSIYDSTQGKTYDIENYLNVVYNNSKFYAIGIN